LRAFQEQARSSARFSKMVSTLALQQPVLDQEVLVDQLKTGKILFKIDRWRHTSEVDQGVSRDSWYPFSLFTLPLYWMITSQSCYRQRRLWHEELNFPFLCQGCPISRLPFSLSMCVCSGLPIPYTFSFLLLVFPFFVLFFYC
jgi:hypothetical protein